MAECIGPGATGASGGGDLHPALRRLPRRKGEGVADEYDEPLVGERSLAALTRRIHRTMPDDDPGSLSGDEAAQVAAYIYDAFYSPAAQARLHPPQVDLARLTIPQYRTVIADLIGSFRNGFRTPLGTERGLKGNYSGVEIEKPKPEAKPEDENSGEVKKKEKAKFDRMDRQVAFSFGTESPDPATMGTEQFSARWRGSVLAEETGIYEFIIKTENGARLWINDTKTQLIDAWVTAGPEVREEKKSIFLLGGRAYPLILEFFKYKDKTASIDLLWKPPHGVAEIIPRTPFVSCSKWCRRWWSARLSRQTIEVLGTSVAPGVSKAWDEATIEAAVAVAEHVEENLEELSRDESGCARPAR